MMDDASKSTCECGYSLRGLPASRPLTPIERAAFLVTGGAEYVVCPECGRRHRVKVKPTGRHRRRTGRRLATVNCRWLLDRKRLATVLLLLALCVWLVGVVRWLIWG